jgi:hypothetical protein
MPVVTEWYDSAQNAIRIAISDPWTINDLSDGIRASRNLMSSVDYSVDAIWDASQTKGAPSNMLSHFMLPNEDSIVPKNQGTVVVVVNNMFLKQFVMIAKRLMPHTTKNMFVVGSLPDAEKKLDSLRPSHISPL